VAHHNPMRRIAVIPRRRESLHGSLNSIRIAQGAFHSFLVSVVPARKHVVFHPTVNHLRAPKRNVVLRTDPTHRAPRTGARVTTDTPHDADVVSVHEDSACAPAGQPARERVEQCEGRDVVWGQILGRVEEPAEGRRAGGPTRAVDD
jgi:hypothetical protein